jgi:ribonuclease Z
VSAREVVALGTSAQVPTRQRAHHATLLRWDGEVVLFDPGEGTQRQLTLAGVSATSITRICITHLHGDHCLGLPGVLQRMALEGVNRPVDLYFPAGGQQFVDHLRSASAAYREIDVREHPVTADGPVDTWGGLSLHAAALDHRIDTYGWRIQEADRRRMLPDRLAAIGVDGADVGRLQRSGSITVGARLVHVDEVSAPRRGQAFAFVMDTRLCRAAVDLARNVDVVVCESTYLSSEAGLAAAYAHLTARQAASIARDAGAHRLVLTHFSQRYGDVGRFADEAAELFSDVRVVHDLDHVRFPSRR